MIFWLRCLRIVMGHSSSWLVTCIIVIDGPILIRIPRRLRSQDHNDGNTSDESIVNAALILFLEAVASLALLQEAHYF
jgi:hypothetical protein